MAEPEKKPVPNPKEQAEHATITTSEGAKKADGTAADALPSKATVDAGVKDAQQEARGDSR